MITLWGKEWDHVKHEKKTSYKTNIPRSLLYREKKQVLQYSKQCFHPCWFVLEQDSELLPTPGSFLLWPIWWNGNMRWVSCFKKKQPLFPLRQFWYSCSIWAGKRSPGSYLVKWALPPVGSAVITGVTAPESIQSMLNLFPKALGIIHLWACFPGQVGFCDLVLERERKKIIICNCVYVR